MPLGRMPEPFHQPEWIFELKFDGFRALAFVWPRSVALVSRDGMFHRSRRSARLRRGRGAVSSGGFSRPNRLLRPSARAHRSRSMGHRRAASVCDTQFVG
jgi:hypothetical protein